MKYMIVVLAMLSCLSQAVAAQGRDYIADADSAFRNGKYETAVRFYNAAYVFNNIDVKEQVKICLDCKADIESARKARYEGNVERAKEFYGYVLDNNPSDTEAAGYIEEHRIKSQISETNMNQCLEYVNIKFHVIDAETKEPLIGANVYKNIKTKSYRFDNWEIGNNLFTWETCGITDIEGLSPIFKCSILNDEIECQYAGYKSKRLQIPFDDAIISSGIYTVELTAYNPKKDEQIRIVLGGMGMNDTGTVTVTNSRTNEQFSMSQKTSESRLLKNVRIGDTLHFTRRGYRPIYVEFKYRIPFEIRIGPMKGSKSAVQYLKF